MWFTWHLVSNESLWTLSIINSWLYANCGGEGTDDSPKHFPSAWGLGWNQIRFANSFLSLHKTFILLVLSSGSGPTYLLFPHNTDERFSSLQFIQYRPISALLQMFPFSDDPSNYFCNNSPCNRIIVCRVIRGQRI